MNRRPVIIDCDPGIDDAVALLLAAHAPELDIRAVTTAAGNVGLEKTTLNARKILTLAGVEYPVCPGADRPLFGAPVTADEFHGADGLMGRPMPEPAFAARSERAWEAMHREAEAWDGKLEIVCTGPMTNLAIALAKYPGLAARLRRVVFMGGAACYGNCTPAAEFNIYADPEAAEMVLTAGIPVVMCGLDVTHKAYLTEEEVATLSAWDTPQTRFCASVMAEAIPQHEKYGVHGSPMHDACAMMYALDSAPFTGVDCWVGVECQGAVTRGKTVTDWMSDAKRTANVHLVTDVDRPAFVSGLLERLGTYRK